MILNMGFEDIERVRGFDVFRDGVPQSYGRWEVGVKVGIFLRLRNEKVVGCSWRGRGEEVTFVNCN